jgi:hypothetical protein
MAEADVDQVEEEALYERTATLQLEYEDGDDVVRNEDIDFLEKYVLSANRLAATAKAFDDDALDYWYWSLLNTQVRDAAEEQEEWVQKVSETDFFPTDPIQQLMYRKSVMEYSAETAEDVMSKLQDIIQDVNLDHEVDASVGQTDAKSFRTSIQV